METPEPASSTESVSKDTSLKIKKGLCISSVMQSVLTGLRRFCGPCAVALVFKEKEMDPFRVVDLFGILSSTKSQIQSHCESKARPTHPFIWTFDKRRTVNQQFWFTNANTGGCAIGPIERWMREASRRLDSSLFLLQNSPDESLEPYLLEGFAPYAISSYIEEKLSGILNRKTGLPVQNVIENVIELSIATEEKKRPNGRLVIVEESQLGDLSFVSKFSPSSSPSFSNFKHVVKNLKCARGGTYLVADAFRLCGIANGTPHNWALTCDFFSGKVEIKLGEECIATIANGRLLAQKRHPSFEGLRSLLLNCGVTSEEAGGLVDVISDLAKTSVDDGNGCTILIDLNQKPVDVQGQHLHEKLDLRSGESGRELAKGMCNIDGAIHLDRKGHLLGFAIILEGEKHKNEDRSRGSRYNSSIRFTGHHKNTVIVVVSEDGMCSFISNGEPVDRRRDDDLLELPSEFPILTDWVKSGKD